MKSIFTFISIILLVQTVSAQPPTQFNYQAIARNTAGIGLSNQAIKLRFSIHDLNPGGSTIYTETRTCITTASGLFTVAIGGAGAITQIGSMDTINWAIGAKFMQVEIDANNGDNFMDMGTTQLLSVPFALQSTKATALNLPWKNTGQSAGKVLMTDYNGEAKWEGGIAFSATNTNNAPVEIPPGNVTITVPLNSVNYDLDESFIGSGSLVDPSTFIAPKEGIYHFEGSVRLSNFAMENGHVFLKLHIIHSTGYGDIEVVQRASTFGTTLQISTDLYLQKGSKVSLRIAQNTSAAGFLGVYSSRFSGRFVMNRF